LNGLGWSFLQNWKWAAHVWPEARYNWGRCWEVCAGISIGIGLGVAYYLVNRQETADRRAARERRLSSTFSDGQWLLAAGLLALDFTVRSNPEEGDEHEQSHCPSCHAVGIPFAELNKLAAAGAVSHSVSVPLSRRRWKCRSCGHEWPESAAATA